MEKEAEQLAEQFLAECTQGDRKLDKTNLIFNLSSALACCNTKKCIFGKNFLIYRENKEKWTKTEKRIFLEKHPVCYAKRESVGKFGKDILHKRLAQQTIWQDIRKMTMNNEDLLKVFASTVVSLIKAKNAKAQKYTIKALRFNESGDIADTLDLHIMDTIAKYLKNKLHCDTFTYTHSTTLLPENGRMLTMHVNVSIDNVNQENIDYWLSRGYSCYFGVGSFQEPIVKQLHAKHCCCTPHCCGKCRLCMQGKPKAIACLFH